MFVEELLVDGCPSLSLTFPVSPIARVPTGADCSPAAYAWTCDLFCACAMLSTYYDCTDPQVQGSSNIRISSIRISSVRTLQCNVPPVSGSVCGVNGIPREGGRGGGQRQGMMTYLNFFAGVVISAGHDVIYRLTDCLNDSRVIYNEDAVISAMTRGGGGGFIWRRSVFYFGPRNGTHDHNREMHGVVKRI